MLKMAKKRENSAAMLFVDIVNNPKSEAYAELCAMCTDANGLQSDKPAASLRAEIKSVLKDLLTGGDLGGVTKKIIKHTREKATIGLRYVTDPPPVGFRLSFRPDTQEIRLGNRVAYFDTFSSTEATPRQLIYGALRQTIESGEISRLAFCLECEKLFYRKSTKGEFCCDRCRWKHNGRKKTRKLEKRKGGKWQWSKNKVHKKQISALIRSN